MSDWPSRSVASGDRATPTGELRIGPAPSASGARGMSAHEAHQERIRILESSWVYRTVYVSFARIHMLETDMH